MGNIVVEQLIRKFKSYIRVGATLLLFAGVAQFLPIDNAPWYMLLGLLIVCYIIVLALFSFTLTLIFGPSEPDVSIEDIDEMDDLDDDVKEALKDVTDETDTDKN